MKFMKKTVSVVYTVFVVAVLLCVIAFFGWKTYQSRAVRISDFVARTDVYTRRLSDTLTENRDVGTEVAIAEKLMNDNPSLIAIQVYSHDDGLRLSVVKSIAGEFSRVPIADSDRFDGFPAKIRYHKISKPMHVKEMQGLEATYVSATLTGAEIRNNLMIILITVVGLFAITLVLIFVKPKGQNVDSDEADDKSPGYQPDEFSDNDELDRFDDNDLFGSGPEISNSMSIDDDFTLPDLDDFPEEPAGSADIPDNEITSRLELELERAASFNQDLSLLIFSGESDTEDQIRNSYTYKDLVFSLDGGNVAVIEINKDLDTALSMTEDFIKDNINSTGSRSLRSGIASRNGRLISAERLLNEAENALRKTDLTKNIVAFRSDPEKYREYLKSQEN